MVSLSWKLVGKRRGLWKKTGKYFRLEVEYPRGLLFLVEKGAIVEWDVRSCSSSLLIFFRYASIVAKPL
jgi:hypothetical protein